MIDGLHSIEQVNIQMNDTSNWVNSVLGRKLAGVLNSKLALTTAELKDAFTGDTVFMRQSDNMFSAYDGAKGTTLGQLNSGVKPASFGSSFP